MAFIVLGHTMYTRRSVRELASRRRGEFKIAISTAERSMRRLRACKQSGAADSKVVPAFHTLALGFGARQFSGMYDWFKPQLKIR
jgi:hypothetical protein